MCPPPFDLGVRREIGPPTSAGQPCCVAGLCPPEVFAGAKEDCEQDTDCEVVTVTAQRVSPGSRSVSHGEEYSDESESEPPPASQEGEGPWAFVKPARINCQPLKDNIEEQHAKCHTTAEHNYRSCVKGIPGSNDPLEAHGRCESDHEIAKKTCDDNKTNSLTDAPGECYWQ